MEPRWVTEQKDSERGFKSRLGLYSLDIQVFEIGGLSVLIIRIGSFEIES
ncbi:unnamed protein product [Moneuplotes crassus]|uniref:Uncharacterized protein n=1 Tax=Euplotes crassus TaxID=5936 RepID=A0AAD1Y5H4_EUPCR|nr:unnamed protein product [Moneuplotes crassus]